MLNVIKKWSAGSLNVFFFEKNNVVCMGMLPAGMEPNLNHRDNVDDSVASRNICPVMNISFKAFEPESMLQLKFSGDGWFGHSGAGTDMRNSATCNRFHLEALNEEPGVCTAEFASAEGMKAVQKLIHHDGTDYIEVQSSLYNGSAETIRVEMFSSFSLGMISLLHNDDAPGSLKLHRMATYWALEARHQVNTFEELGLDMSWQAGGVRALRFGQRSSCVNKEFSPLVAVEDAAHGVVWAAAVEGMTPWQMEVSRYTDFVNLSGGLPDREFDGWFIDLKPGETLTAPIALLTVAQGTFEHAARNLLAYQRTAEPEERLTPVFSDWCTSWGIIDSARLLRVAERAAMLGVKYFSVDDGWFKRETPGEWDLNPEVFPQSFRHFADEIKARFGLTAGIWFEFESVINPDIKTYPKKDQLLTLDGKPIQAGIRYFWDFRKPEVIRHLTEKVADFLNENHIGYLKVDYNAPIAFGVDGDNVSPAANLQEAMNAVIAFHHSLRRLVPGLCLEECASGGNRMTPGWVRMSSLQSCSDAHEGIEIPILAADTMVLCDYDKALVWATLRADDDEARLSYSLCAGMLGKMQLSGDLDKLDDGQMAFVRKFIAFYGGISVPLRRGELAITRATQKRTNPEGTQVVRLETPDEMLLVVHFFATAETSIDVALPTADWRVADWVAISGAECTLAESSLHLKGMKPFSAAAIRLGKTNRKC